MTTIKQRRGTAAQWTTANPVLAAGEPGVETDTGNHKVGDGTTAWNSLKTTNSATYVARSLSTLKAAHRTTTRLDPAGNSLQVIGIDTVDNRLFAVDHSSGDFIQSTDWGDTHEWGSKGYPTGSDHTSIDSMIRFGANLYAVARNTGTGATAVWRTPPALGNIGVPPAVPYTWTQVKALASGAQESAGPLLTQDGTYIYATEYANPSGGPSVYRSSDGTTWTTVYGPDSAVLHAHCLWADPYNAGHIYLTLGDGTARSIVRSTDHGGTWTVIIADSDWQAVQISGDATYIYLASDTGTSTFHVIRRSDLTPLIGSTNFHYNLAVPGAAASTDRYYQACYYGAVDPATGVYYCVANDSSKPGNKSGLFYAPMAGAPLQILDPNVIAGKVYIAGGYVIHGSGRHKLLTFA